jgi:hypothetical protein
MWVSNLANGFVIPADINFTGINIFLAHTVNYKRSAYDANSMTHLVLNQ